MRTETTSYGVHHAAIGRPTERAGAHHCLRITEFVAPCHSPIPPNDECSVASVIVPIDDDETAFHLLAFGGPNVPSTERWRAFDHAVPGEDLDHEWRTGRPLENHVMQDRETTKAEPARAAGSPA